MPLLRALAAAATVLVVAAVGLVAVGGAFGNPWLLLPRVPPRSGMDRFLVWAWPTACLFEGMMAMAGDRSRWCPKQAFVEAGFGRLVAAAYLGGTLLAGSVFLQPDADVLPLLAWAALCGSAWHLIASSRQQVVAAVVLVVAVLATGGLILVGGWIRGGLVAVPIAVAVGGVACIRLTPFRHVAVGCGAAGLLGLIGLGHFFGRVTVVQASTVVAASVAAVLVWPWLERRLASRQC